MMRTIAVLLLLLFGSVAVARVESGYVTIEEVPVGDAPAWVREMWIGVRLPYEMEGACSNVGIVTQRQMPHGHGIYVLQETALDILRASSPKAAKWWNDHGFPQPNGIFCFARQPYVS